MDLYDKHGHRKYLTPTEWRAFLQAAEAAPEGVTTFCGTLAYSGCRISEALAFTADRVDIGDGVLIFRSLKKRDKRIFRAVPVPPELLESVARTHGLPGAPGNTRLWNWSRATAWRRVCEVMDAAGIKGMHATPKGLRHGFGIRAVASGVPLNMTQKWLGQASIIRTSTYCNPTGPEERQLAARMWA